MQVGITVPITEFGADPQFHPEVPVSPYTHQSYIHEPMTLMGYLAAITTRPG